MSNSAAHMAFGERIRDARLGLGLAPEQLAKLAGCTDRQIPQLEEHGCGPRSKSFFTLCELLGIDPMECGFTGREADVIRRWRKGRGEE